MRKVIAIIIVTISCLLLANCATEKSMYYAQGPDPLQQLNRNTYRLNDKLDRWLLKPAAQGYNYIFPNVIRQGFSNFYENLTEPTTIANDILQGHFYWTMNDFWRLVINSTIGIGGLIDVAADIGLTPHDNDFGLTLRTWGAQPLPYLILPVLGPNDLGSFVGLVPDYLVSPWFYPLTDYPVIKYPIYVFKGIGVRARLLEHENLAQQLALDPYIFMRSAYYQYRNNQMRINENPPIVAEASAKMAKDKREAEKKTKEIKFVMVKSKPVKLPTPVKAQGQTLN